jgi:hypothetical protein
MRFSSGIQYIKQPSTLAANLPPVLIWIITSERTDQVRLKGALWLSLLLCLVPGIHLLNHLIHRRGVFARFPCLDQQSYIIFLNVFRVKFQIIRSDTVNGLKI